MRRLRRAVGATLPHPHLRRPQHAIGTLALGSPTITKGWPHMTLIDLLVLVLVILLVIAIARRV